MDAPVVVQRLTGDDEGRRVTIAGEPVGVAFHQQDVIEFLRRAGISDPEAALDDPRVVEWRGGGPDEWPDPRQ